MATYNHNALSIQVSLNGLSFCILNKDTKTLDYVKTVTFEQKLTPFDTLNRIKAIISSETIFSKTFNSIQVIHQNELVSLVPNHLYDKNYKADYLKFNSKILKTDFLATDDLDINKSTNVYVPYVNVNNYIFENFGIFHFKHASTILIESLLKPERNSETATVYINVNSTHFEIIVIKDNALQLYNYFNYSTKEDFIYYVLFVFEQLGLNTEETPIFLSGLIHRKDDLYNILYTYVKHIEFIVCNYDFNSKDFTTKEDLHYHFLILNSF